MQFLSLFFLIVNLFTSVLVIQVKNTYYVNAVSNASGTFWVCLMHETAKTPPNLRLLHLVSVMADNNGHITVVELIDRLGLPKQTVHRLVTTLQNEGFIERQGRFLAPSHKLLGLASGLLQTQASFDTRHKILKDIAALTGETVNLVMPQADGMRYVDRVDTNWGFRFLLPIGTHVPFHCTASGKTYMAYMRKDQRKIFVKRLTFEAFTTNTHTSPDTLHLELDNIKKQGYAMDNEELYEDMLAIAVPIFDSAKRYCASLAIHGPKVRFGTSNAFAAIDPLKAASKEISKVMFGT